MSEKEEVLGRRASTRWALRSGIEKQKVSDGRRVPLVVPMEKDECRGTEVRTAMAGTMKSIARKELEGGRWAVYKTC